MASTDLATTRGFWFGDGNDGGKTLAHQIEAKEKEKKYG
jgi:hypothetical protein